MSRYFGIGFAGTEDGRADAQDVRKRTQIQKDGSRWRGGSRTGARSLMDQAEYNRQAADYWNKYSTGPGSEAGVYNLKVVGDDGSTPMKGAIINIGGKMFKSSEDEGRLRILDSEYLNSEISAFKELRDYEEKIVQALLVSDETASLIIGTYKRRDAAEILAKDGLAQVGIDAPGIDVDATPSSIRYLDPSSTAYAQAIAKLRVMVHSMGIIVNEEGGNLAGAGLGIKRAEDSGNDAARAVTA